MKIERKGYTLVEIMVVVILFSLLFAVIFEILATSRTSWDIGSTKQTLENQARLGLENMARELYRTNLGKTSIGGSGDNQMVTFQVPVGYNVGGNLLWGAEGIQNYNIRYSLSGSQLLRQVLDNNLQPLSPPSERVLANDTQSLKFTLTNNLLTITLTTQKNALGNRPLSQTFSSKVTFRN